MLAIDPLALWAVRMGHLTSGDFGGQVNTSDSLLCSFSPFLAVCEGSAVTGEGVLLTIRVKGFHVVAYWYMLYLTECLSVHQEVSGLHV